MKLFLLKRKFQQILLLASFMAVTITSEALYGTAVEDPYFPQIEQTLTTCLKDKSDHHSFQYFVDHLIEILRSYISFLENHQHRSRLEEQNGGITTGVMQSFMGDLQKIRDSKNVVQVGLILAKYKRLLPGSLKNMSLQQMAVGLKFRLSR